MGGRASARKRTRRLAWRGRSSRASFEGLEPAVKARGTDTVADRRAGASAGDGRGQRAQIHRDRYRRSGCAGQAAWDFMPDGQHDTFHRIEELEGGDLSFHPFRSCAFGHGPRHGRRHHNIPGRDDDQASDGGLGGPQHPQHGRYAGQGNPRSRRLPSRPSRAKSTPMMPFSALLLRLTAKSQSTAFLPFIQNKT